LFYLHNDSFERKAMRYLKPIFEVSSPNWCVCERKCFAQYIFVSYWVTELVPKYNLQTNVKVCWRCVECVLKVCWRCAKGVSQFRVIWTTASSGAVAGDMDCSGHPLLGNRTP